MNKRKLAFLMLCMFMITFFTGCSDDDGYADVDGQAPQPILMVPIGGIR